MRIPVVGCEGGAEKVDMTKVEVGGPGDVIDMGLEREGGVEDDTQTLDLKGGWNQRVVGGEVGCR